MELIAFAGRIQRYLYENTATSSIFEMFLTERSEMEYDNYDPSQRRRFLSSGSGTDSSQFYTDVILVIVCLICAGLASGLTQGLLSLDIMEMTIKARSGNDEEKRQASRVLPIITRHHLLLVSLMLWNAAANEALPIFLTQLVPEWLAIVLSVTMILFVGEILPASVLTGPNQLRIAASLTPLVYFVLFVFYPLASPIALALDHWLGHEEGLTTYNRKEIATLMNIQQEEGAKRRHGDGQTFDAVHHEEVTIIGGALKYRDMMVRDVMTPVEKVFMLSAGDRLNYKTLSEIFISGYSRIPVFDLDRNDIIGLVLAKDLIFVDPDDETPIANFVKLFGRMPAVIWHDQSLGETLSLFRKGRSHMAIVRNVNDTGPGDPFYEVVGIITLEDIIEEIIGAEIEDETDYPHASESEKATKRDADLARLKLLNAKMADAELSIEEAKAIAAHLITNVPQIHTLFENNLEALTVFVQRSDVLEMKRSSKDNARQPLQEDILYRRGKMSNSCLLILSGKIGVLAGKDAFLSELGPWSTIAADSLISSDGSYIPDFSAYVSSESLRAVRLTVHSMDMSSIAPLQKRKEELGITSFPERGRTHSLSERKRAATVAGGCAGGSDGNDNYSNSLQGNSDWSVKSTTTDSPKNGKHSGTHDSHPGSPISATTSYHHPVVVARHSYGGGSGGGGLMMNLPGSGVIISSMQRGHHQRGYAAAQSLTDYYSNQQSLSGVDSHTHSTTTGAGIPPSSSVDHIPPPPPPASSSRGGADGRSTDPPPPPTVGSSGSGSGPPGTATAAARDLDLGFFGGGIIRSRFEPKGRGAVTLGAAGNNKHDDGPQHHQELSSSSASASVIGHLYPPPRSSSRDDDIFFSASLTTSSSSTAAARMEEGLGTTNDFSTGTGVSVITPCGNSSLYEPIPSHDSPGGVVEISPAAAVVAGVAAGVADTDADVAVDSRGFSIPKKGAVLPPSGNSTSGGGALPSSGSSSSNSNEYGTFVSDI